MAPSKEGINLNTFNCRGMAQGSKRRTIFKWLKKYHEGITLLQETHTVPKVENEWLKEWGSEIIFNHGTQNSTGGSNSFS